MRATTVGDVGTTIVESRVGGLRGVVVDVADAVRFLSRLPLPLFADVPRALSVTLGVAPLAGLVIASGPALILAGALVLGLASFVAATLAITALIAVTGALHEDGLADCADGFGGGSTRERKLAIMRDSSIGSYGALALGCGLLLRVGALQAIALRAGPKAALILLAAAALSRACMIVPLALLAPARPDGLARHAGAPDGAALMKAMVLGLPIVGLLAFAGGSGGGPLLLGLLLSGSAAIGMTWLAQRQIGGVTGDVVGATQQVVETIFLVVLCATPSVA